MSPNQENPRISDIRADIHELRREIRELTRDQNTQIAGLRINIEKIKDQQSKISEVLAALKVKTGIMSTIGGAVAGTGVAVVRSFLGK